MRIKSEEDWLKQNIIELVNHHRKQCNGETCDINLIGIMLLAKKAGIKFTKDEKLLFL